MGLTCSALNVMINSLVSICNLVSLTGGKWNVPSGICRETVDHESLKNIAMEGSE